MYGTGTKILSLLLIAVLVTSSFQTGFQNFSQNTNSNYTHKAFASNTVDIAQISNYAVFGMQSAVIENGVTIVNGSVGVQNSGPLMISHDNGNNDVQNNDGNNADNHNVEQENAVVIEKDSKFLDPNSALVGDNVIIEKGTTVQNVFFNKLQNAGIILGTQNTPLSLPVVKSLPPFPHSTPGSASIDVPDGSSLTLQPGIYGSISVGKSSTLNLVGGIYNVTSIEVADGSSLLFSSPSQVVVQNQTELGKGVTVGPSTSSVMHAHDIIFFVGGETSIEKNDTIKANIFSPSDISIEKDANLTGAFIAKSVEIGTNSQITHDSAFVAFDLVNRFMNINSELGKISEISDESVVTDYLNQNITSLKTVTTNLVADSGARSTLSSTLDSALQSVSNAGISVLALDDTGANINIDQARAFVGNYINQVTALKGNIIPTSTADILLFKANEISSNSLKRGIDSTNLLSGISLTITSQIINKAKSDVSQIRTMGSQLVSLGFTFSVQAQTHSPTTGFTLISNTLQQFKIEITPLAQAASDMVLIANQAAAQGVQATNAELAALLITLPPVIQKVITSTVTSVAVRELFVKFSVCSLITVETGPLDPIICGAFIGITVGFFLEQNPEIRQQFLDVISSAPQIVQNTFSRLNVLPPKLTVIKQVINNFGGTAVSGDFTIHVTNNGQPLATFPGNSSGMTKTLSPGTYDAQEDPKGGYNQTFNDCSSLIKGPITTGENRTCTIINNDTSPTLTVIKKIDNTGGGTLALSGVTLKINGTTVTNGTANPRNAGTYVVSENTIPNYSKKITGDCDPTSGKITLKVGDINKVCTITNTFTPPTLPPVFFDNFDDGPLTSTGWSPVSCPSGLDCIGQSTLSQLGFPAISQPFWGFVRNFAFGSFFCSPSSVSTSKSFTVTQAGNYNVSAWIAPSICGGCIIHNQLFVDSNLLFDHGVGFVSPSPPPVFDKTVIPLSAGTHSVTMQMFATAECNGAFPTYMDNISIQQTSSPATPPPVGGPYFSLQVNQTSVNATKGSTTVVPLKVIWDMGHTAEPVSATFMGNTTSVIPSITSVSNTTSSQLFNVTLNVPSGVQTGNYYVAINIIEPDGNSQVISIPVRVQ